VTSNSGTGVGQTVSEYSLEYLPPVNPSRIMTAATFGIIVWRKRRMQTLPDKTPPVLAVILPCYNEEMVLPATVEAISVLLQCMTDSGRISPESFALYVDDGSLDATWDIIAYHHRGNPRVHGLKFASNAGIRTPCWRGWQRWPPGLTAPSPLTRTFSASMPSCAIPHIFLMLQRPEA